MELFPAQRIDQNWRQRYSNTWLLLKEKRYVKIRNPSWRFW